MRAMWVQERLVEEYSFLSLLLWTPQRPWIQASRFRSLRSSFRKELGARRDGAKEVSDGAKEVSDCGFSCT